MSQQFKKPDSVDQMWKLFIIRVRLQTMSDLQRREMEMAFKAGCASMLMEMKGPVADLPEDAAIRTIERWTHEMNEFFRHRVREYKGQNPEP